MSTNVTDFSFTCQECQVADKSQRVLASLCDLPPSLETYKRFSKSQISYQVIITENQMIDLVTCKAGTPHIS